MAIKAREPGGAAQSLVDMRALQYIAAFVAFLIAIVGFLLMQMSIDTHLVTRTLENSREIDASFKQAAAFVDQHRETTGRLPSPEEFLAWQGTQPRQPYSVRNLRLQYPPFADEYTSRHGVPPTDA